MITIKTQKQANKAQSIINEILNSDNGIQQALNRHYMNTWQPEGSEKSIGELFIEKPLHVQLRTIYRESVEDRLIQPANKPSFTIYAWSKPRLQILVALGQHAKALWEYEQLEEHKAQLQRLGVKLNQELGEF